MRIKLSALKPGDRFSVTGTVVQRGDADSRVLLDSAAQLPVALTLPADLEVRVEGKPDSLWKVEPDTDSPPGV